MVKTFYAQLQDFADACMEDMEAVMKASIQDTVKEMQTPVGEGGRMPVVDGFLRGSLASDVNGGGFGAPSADSYAVAIAGMKVGDTARFAYTVAYAMRQEMGFVGPDKLGRVYEQAGKHFMGSAAANFPNHVATNIRKLKS